MKALLYNPRPAGWLTCLLVKRLWKGCVLSRLGGLSLRELPTPALPGDDWVLCRTVLGGICGSDLALIRQRQPVDSVLQAFTSLPMVLGHESVAVVEQTGPKVDPGWRGRRVCVEPTLACRQRGIDPPCRSCRGGQYGACENFSAGGEGASRLPAGMSIGYCAGTGGSWGEFFLAHQSQLIEMPAGLGDREALLTDPLACALHAVLRSRAGPGRSGGEAVERVLVYGAGIMGLGVVWGLRAIGHAGAIDVVARHEHQGQWARRLGATEVLPLPPDRPGRYEAIAARLGARVAKVRLGGYMVCGGGYDAVFECAGGVQTIQDSLRWTRARGQVVLLATGSGRGADLAPLWFRELDVVGAYGRGLENVGGRSIGTYQLVHELMRTGKADLAGLVTHTFGLSDYRAALATAMGKGPSGAIKVALEYDGAGGDTVRSEPACPPGTR